MDKNAFVEVLRKTANELSSQVSDAKGDWTVKGFIDVSRNIYTISSDTKVISKILELYIFPRLLMFAEQNDMEIELAKEQNFYPDITFKDKEGNLFAVDLKSSYRKNATHINGMTLGSFTGYFRQRQSAKNIMYPYGEYKAHIVLGIIYDVVSKLDEREIYNLDQLCEIVSVIRNFQFFVQEKWKIATDRPGSGNTKNIGSVTRVDELLNGKGVFSLLGEDIFNDYWMYYLTNDMARAAELPKPHYKNIAEYKQFKHIE